MRKSRGITIHKFEQNVTNEDAVFSSDSLIAVSDGAGGGGMYADQWSRYLVERLPDEPIYSAEALDKWLEEIWEPFYKESENRAKQAGGIVLNKFYDEGSFATLVAAWNTKTGVNWMAYGDSVAFCYNYKSRKLTYSFSKLNDFIKAPYLINCKDELKYEGYKKGTFRKTACRMICFVASDTLSHYILMMYMVTHRKKYAEELEKAIAMKNKHSLQVQNAMRLANVNFREVLNKLIKSSASKHLFRSHLAKLQRQGLLGHDDYSFAYLIY